MLLLKDQKETLSPEEEESKTLLQDKKIKRQSCELSYCIHVN